MPFDIIWTKKAEKNLKLIDKKVALIIYEKIEELKMQECIFLEKLKNSNYYKFRIGKYRVLIRKFPAVKKLFIMKVGHRKNIYKKI